MGFVENTAKASTARWEYTSGSINRKNLSFGEIKYIILKETPANTFLQEKNYQVVIGLSQSSAFSTSNTQFRVKMREPFPIDTFAYDNYINADFSLSKGSGPGQNAIFFYSNPETTGNNSYILEIGADEQLDNSQGIRNITINEIDFLIYGYRVAANDDGQDPLSPSDVSYNGWLYDSTNESYRWYSSNTGVDPQYSEFGSGISPQGGFKFITPTLPHTENFIAKKIDYDYFNMSFIYATAGGNPTDGVDIYIGSNLNNTGTWDLVGSLSGLTQSVAHQLFGLTGTNLNGTKNYLIFSGSQSTSSGFLAQISDIKIYGGYHPNNNEQFLFTNTNNYSDPELLQIIGATSATYSFIVGWGSTILGTFSEDTNTISSNFGNGTFKAGIWENGIWNSGWRVDENYREFDDVSISIRSLADVRWRIQVRGSKESVDFFNIGDKVSISNIVAVDINENRKLLKGYFTIIAKSTNTLTVETDTTFPYRRIKKDSDNHKIKVTKNIWLSGAFLNGYYSGVWNYGLFKGYPLITEMFDTHWIDGIFDGGRFNSFYPSYEIADFWYISANTWGLDDSLNGNLGLTFSSGHNLLEGDYVIIDKDNKSVNIEYDGVAKIVAVIDENLVVTDKEFGTSTTNETASAFRYTATGVMQNLEFHDNNRSSLTSFQSKLSTSVFSFNSWLDINYDPTRSVTIGKDFRKFEPLTRKSTNVTNLYGYPTYDVLSSVSYFRDSYTLNTNSYNLGTKYKVFEDFIGDGSNFNEPFGPQQITDKLILSIDRETFTDSGSSVTFLPGTTSIYVVPIDITPSNYNDISILDITGSITDDSDPVQMTSDLADAINSATSSPNYLAFAENNQLTIWDESGQSFDIRGIRLESKNYKIRRDNEEYSSTSTISYRYYNSSVIYPEQQVSNNQVIKFGRDVSGVGYDQFYENGWDFSSEKKYGSFTLSRTDAETSISVDNGISNTLETENIEEKLLVEALNNGGVLNNSNIRLPKNRYSVIEFDIASYSVPQFYYTYDNETGQDPDLPVLHFNNLNYEFVNTTQRQYLTGIPGLGPSITVQVQNYNLMTYLPVNQNINHIFTENTFRLDSVEETTPEKWGGFGNNQPSKKYEYFYNKTDLMMQFYGNGASGSSQSAIILDNLKMYEVDMVPFFQYFLDANIYKGVQVPYQAVAPFIDYTDSNFVFLDNISIGLDSIDAQQSFEPISGVGPGVGITIDDGGGIFGPPDQQFGSPNTLFFGP